MSTYDRELLAAYSAVLHFKSLIDGQNTTLFVDHKPIVSAFHSKNVPRSDRQQRQLSIISEYVADVQYIKGYNNIVADFLSRPINAINVDTFDFAGISVAQKDDKELDKYPNLKEYQIQKGLKILCDDSTPIPRPFVPSCLREKINV